MNNKKRLRNRLAAKRKQLAAEWKVEIKVQTRIDKLTDEVRSLEEKLRLKKGRT